jgi:hypothetical protein
MQARRSGAVWDPIVVWEQEDASGNLTGQLVLLDGDHRLAGYATLAKRGPKWGGGIAATIVGGERQGDPTAHPTRAFRRRVAPRVRPAVPHVQGHYRSHHRDRHQSHRGHATAA